MDYDYTTTMAPFDSVNGEMEGIFAALGGFLIAFAIIVVALAIFMIIAEWKFFKKSGKNGWECIIPFYSTWVLTEIADLNWWWFLVMIASSLGGLLFGTDSALTTVASLATIFGNFVCNFNIAKKYHKEVGFAILMTIFPIVMIPILAFGKKNQYDSSVVVSKNGLF